MSTKTMVRLAASAAAFAVMTAVAAGPVVAKDVDAKGDKELVAHAQKIDKAAAGHDSGRVTARVVDAWKGTTFRFEAGSAPRALTTQDVQDLRAKRLGYGEITILLALAANQPNQTSAKSVSEILAMRQAGAGWGKIGGALGYRNLGSVDRRLQATERGMTQLADRGPKPEKTAAMAKPEKIEKPEKVEKPDKPEKAEKPGR